MVSHHRTPPQEVLATRIAELEDALTRLSEKLNQVSEKMQTHFESKRNDVFSTVR